MARLRYSLNKLRLFNEYKGVSYAVARRVGYRLDLIEQIFSGYVTICEVEAATLKTFELAPKERPARFLADLRDVELQHSLVDLYLMPKQWQRMQFVRESGLALLVSDTGKMMKYAQFFETACRNQGWQVRLFTQRQDAIDWLQWIAVEDQQHQGI